MKYYQCRNSKIANYAIAISYTLVMAFASIIVFGNFGAATNNEDDYIFYGIFFLLFTLLGVYSIIHMKVFKIYERTVEIAADGITFASRSKEVVMNWDDVGEISLYHGGFSVPRSRVIFFMARTNNLRTYNKSKATSKKIWSEYNDEMIEEIKKYWDYEIINEDKYIEYKNKKGLV